VSRAKRISHLDVLGEVRRALRVLRRIERWLAQQERDQRRRQRKFEQRRKAAAEPDELASQG